MQYAAQSNLKKVSLECGGKSPNIVLADCPDLDKAATAAAYAIFFNQGEMCSAGSRLLVEASIKDAMLEKIAAVGRQMKPGDPLDPATKLGAIVDETQMKRVLLLHRRRQDGRRQGGAGRQRVREDSGGFSCEPTVFDGVLPAMRIAREEIFGRARHDPRSRPSTKRSRSPTTWNTDSPRRCGHATSTWRIARRARCAPARCT
jgi:4-guanidinobutyraldehyde dehydrogenase/NAD-dependent aldehyde dehydrogenase